MFLTLIELVGIAVVSGLVGAIGATILLIWAGQR